MLNSVHENCHTLFLNKLTVKISIFSSKFNIDKNDPDE